MHTKRLCIAFAKDACSMGFEVNSVNCYPVKPDSGCVPRLTGTRPGEQVINIGKDIRLFAFEVNSDNGGQWLCITVDGSELRQNKTLKIKVVDGKLVSEFV